MYELIFSNNTSSKSVSMGYAKTEEEADQKLSEKFVRFCRDVSHKPLDRDYYAYGFTWQWKGITYGLFRKEVEEKDEHSN